MLSFDINTKKNLLAFSAGIDSTALFFLLLNNKIPFDIAIVDYGQRDSSKKEIKYAKKIASQYNKKIFTKKFPQKNKFSEHLARKFRYDFFNLIIKKNRYKSLITAHQLNDKFEWLMMQLSKGAGLIELVGMKEKENRKHYTLIRPLLKIPKSFLLKYLIDNKVKFFIDETNNDLKYERNNFRLKYKTDNFIDKYHIGLNRSFEYLALDINDINMNNIKKNRIKDLAIYKINNFSTNKILRIINQELKSKNILLSYKTRKEIINNKKCVVSHKISISIDSNFIWISPYCNTIMDKKFKEKCRINNIPSNIRPYLYTINFTNFDKIPVKN